jgi:hypothetical protein
MTPRIDKPTPSYWSLPALAFYVYATLLTLTPAIFLLPVGGKEAAIPFLTGDAYLYLGIGEHSTPAFFSFDGARPTNGFHPLWQYFVWLAAHLTHDKLAYMNVVAWTNIGCALLGILLLGAAIARATRSWLLAGLVVPGVYFLLVGQGLQGNLSVWNFFSGMECGLALALTGLIALFVVHIRADERRPWFWLVLGIMTGILMLCRLDEVFVPAMIGLAWLLWYPSKAVGRMPAVVLLGGPPALMLAAYLAYNLTHVGVAFPISGAAKGEGALVSNIWVTLSTFFAPITAIRATLTSYVADYAGIRGAGFRVAELVVPTIFALAFIKIIHAKHRDAPWAPILAGMCAAIVVKGLYNGVAVGFWHQAPWYFGYAMGTISVTAALLLAPYVERWKQASPISVALVAAVIAGVSFLQASQDFFSRAERLQSSGQIAFLKAAPAIDAALERQLPKAKILEFGDGMINFAMPRPVRHGFVFAGDVGSLKAMQQGRLLQASYDDGYRILSSYEYYGWPDVSLDKSSDEIRDHLAKFNANYGIVKELDKFDYKVIYVYAPQNVPFIAFWPKK